MANKKKLSQLESLVSFIDKARNFALINYQSTKHLTLEQLRKELKKSGATLRMLKNSLFEKALNKMSVKDPALKNFRKQAFPLKDNTGIVSLGKDWNNGLGAFYQFTKKEKTLTLKIGLLDQAVYADQTLARIAQLPSREVLLAKTVGGMKSPLSHFHRALTYNMQKFVYILSKANGNSKSKSQESPMHSIGIPKNIGTKAQFKT